MSMIATFVITIAILAVQLIKTHANVSAPFTSAQGSAAHTAAETMHMIVEL